MISNALHNGDYCIYLRKSRKDIELEALGEGETLARHEKTLLALSRSLKVPIKKIFREVVSGETIQERPEIQKLLKEVEDGIWAGVFVMEVERLARGDTSDQGVIAQAFKFSSTKIVTPSKIYDPENEFDEEYFEFGLFMSRREFKTINRRLQNGRLTSISEGKYVGNIPPYGYKKYKLPKEKGYSLEIIPEEAKIVQMIFDLYVNGEVTPNGDREEFGTALIAKKLNTLKVPSAKGGLWRTSTIQSILRNPVYMGKIKWGSRPLKKRRVDGKIVKSRPRLSINEMKLVQGRHENIVSDELWWKANNKLSLNPAKPVPAHLKIASPLVGLVYCGFCGRAMVRRPHPNQNDSLICQIPECKNVSSFLYLVEQRIIESLKKWLVEYKTDWDNNKRIEEQNNDAELLENAINKIDKDIDNLKIQLDNLHDLLEQNIYTPDVFIDRTKKITEKTKKLDVEKTNLLKQLEALGGVNDKVGEMIPVVEHVLDLYSLDHSPALRNEMLKSVLSKVVYTKEKGARWHGSLDDFSIKIFPKLPRDHH
ncbi:recombinase family protein [Paenibacillus medicaginis]|uniref:Recombinase family protein n=1 Tax=Paenibacillus medicaginis TaxID=1470560 RepID=A0ABV5C0V2_9BACL